VVTSYSPLGGPQGTLLSSPLLAEIAARHQRTPAQVVLRWHVQQGLAVIPKSASPTRMRENLAVFDFALDETDLAALALLDGGPSVGVDSDRVGHQHGRDHPHRRRAPGCHRGFAALAGGA